MSDTNNTTIQSYDAHVEEYVKGTPQQVDSAHKAWIDANLAALVKTAHILELGSAFGRDAAYMEGQGFKVERTDVTPAFVTLLKQQGHEARILDALHDPLHNDYDMIFASAVLLHFTREEAALVIDKVFGALKTDGRFVFSLKQVDGEAWEQEKLGAPRFFCYWHA